MSARAGVTARDRNKGDAGGVALPAGLLVRAPREEIARGFAALAALQPVRWAEDGLVCAPRAAPDLAAPALAGCRLPTRALDDVPGWPDPPSDSVAGWYRRSVDHAPAPPQVRELIQVAGPAFGSAGHHTTALCLRALGDLPDGPAFDAGCGSGMLSLAWATLGKGPVLAWDLDPDALRQTREAARVSGLGGLIEVCRGSVERASVGDRVLLANLPPIAHRALLAGLAEPPVAAILSGMRCDADADVLEGYLAAGLRTASSTRDGAWACWVLVRA